MAIIGMGRVGIRSIAAPSNYTTRTTAFAAATGIADTTILNALNTFDTGLISNGLDTKMKALYPFVGGTATTHKYNFMDARDLDVAFRLQFNGGLVHSSTGCLPNGTNGYASTYYTPPSGNAGMFYYSRTNNGRFECSIGAYNSSLNSQSILFLAPGGTYASMNSQTFSYSNPTITTTLGFFGVIRVGGDIITNTNGNVATQTTARADTLIPLNLFNRGGSNDLYSTKQCAGAGFIENYTSSELTILKNLINTFNTTLSRAV